MKLRSSDTIVAIATPLGTGAISIVRMSGPDAVAMADRVFHGNSPLSATPGYTIRHGKIVDLNNETIDEVLVSVFRSPHSYTGEDCVEVNCHGGVFVTKKVLATLLDAGARQADPGEFTKRAFLNGKMDLAQAEAVADLISANSDRALMNSTAQLRGTLGDSARRIKDELTRIRSLLELELDFSQEGISFASGDSVENALVGCVEDLQSAISSFKRGKVLREGASVAIVGRPNVGKSSLFNRLLMDDRSIVSSTPGTTRDFLEESMVIDGLLIRLYDTAGLRTSLDEIETEGIKRTKVAMSSSDVVLFLLDTDDGDINNDLDELRKDLGNQSTVIMVRSKIDLGTATVPADGKGLVRVSAETGEGLDRLRNVLLETILGGASGGESNFSITSYRHHDSLKKCMKYTNEAIVALRSRMTPEFVASDLAFAADAIAEILGEVTSDDLLDEVFTQFCIGK